MLPLVDNLVNLLVLKDSVVDFPAGLQWIAGPRWTRDHEATPVLSCQVTSGGRLFYVHDQGPIGVIDKRVPTRTYVIARDALKTPDYVAFGKEAAAKLDAMGRRRPVVYTYLADYLVDRFNLSLREGVAIDIGGGAGDLGIEVINRVLKEGKEAYIGRGLTPNMPENEARILFERRVVGGPKYNPDADAKRFRFFSEKTGDRGL